LNTGLATGLIGAGIGKLGGMSTEDALKMGLVSGVSAGGMKAFVGDPESYAIKSKILTLAEAGDQTALALRDSGNVEDMKAYIDSTSAPVSTTAPGPVPTAAELVNQPGPNPSGPRGVGLRMPMSMEPVLSTTGADFSTGVGGTAQTTNYDMLARGYETPAAGLRPRTLGFPPDFSIGAGGTASATNYSLTPSDAPAAPAAPAGPTGFFDKMVTGAGNMYDKYLSPDRPGLPTDAGFFRKYGPLAAAGTATIAAFGGMDSSPAEIDAMTAAERARYEESRLRARARREFMEKGGYGLEKPVFNTAYDPVVPASYRPLPTGAPGAVVPTGVTQSPPGVAQPYNVAGLYGVPLLYGPDGQLRRMAKGGYIGRFSDGGDAGYEERRQRAQDRRDFMERGGYGLEGPVLDTSYRNALSPLRMTGTVGQLDQYDGVNNSGDQRGPGSGPAGGIPGLNIDPLALGLGRVAGLFGSSVSLGKPAPVDERSSYTPAALAEFQAAMDREAQAEANVAGYEGQGNFLGGSDSFGEGQYAKGGPAKMTRFPRRDGPINGPGTGTSDNIPAMLSDGEFVFTAKAVRNAGGGSRRKGAARMYKLMKKLEGGAVKGN